MCKPVKSIFFLRLSSLFCFIIQSFFLKKKKKLYKVSSIVKNIFRLKQLTKPTNKCDFGRVWYASLKNGTLNFCPRASAMVG